MAEPSVRRRLLASTLTLVKLMMTALPLPLLALLVSKDVLNVYTILTAVELALLALPANRSVLSVSLMTTAPAKMTRVALTTLVDLPRPPSA